MWEWIPKNLTGNEEVKLDSAGKQIIRFVFCSSCVLERDITIISVEIIQKDVFSEQRG